MDALVWDEDEGGCKIGFMTLFCNSQEIWRKQFCLFPNLFLTSRS